MGSSSPSFAIGIDLGSISSCVAVLRDHTENPKVIPSNVGRNSTPSFVWFNFEDGEETVYAGQAAEELALDHPQNSVFDIKRLIGELFHDQRIQMYKKLWPLHLVNVTGLVGVKLGERTLLPHVIAKELLSHLKTTAELFLGCSVDSAIVAIPVYYSEMQKGLTKWACEEAGFTSVQLIPEPVSAAIAYGLQTSIKSHEIKTCLTYDLGGRSFEATVFRLGVNRQVDVIASGRRDRLGGEDFTDLLTEYCFNQFKRINGIDLFEGKASDNAEVRKTSERMLRRIRNECEINKCFLSDTSSVVVSIDHVHGGKSMNVRVTLEIFENLISSLLTRSIEIVDETLKKCGVEKNEIDDVILIGGSSRIPKVQQMVDEYFKGKRLLSSISMDEAVACGAAIYAHDIFTHKGKGGAPLSIITFKEQLVQCWSNIQGFPPRSRHAAAAIGTTIYSFGGNNTTDHPSYLRDGPFDIFALKTDDAKVEWKSLSVENPEFSPNQRWYHSAVAYKEFVLIFGGWDTKKNAYSNSVHRFNTHTLTWDAPEVSGNIPEARSMHSCVVVEHELIVFGGFNYGIELKNDLHSLNLETFHWSIIQGKGLGPSLCYAHSATVYKNSFIFIFGGYDSKKGEYLQDLFCFDVILKEWTVPKTGGTTPQSRRGHAAFTHDGLMLIFGGENAEYSCLNDVFSYNLGQLILNNFLTKGSSINDATETGEWTEIKPIGQPPSPRQDFACVSLND